MKDDLGIRIRKCKSLTLTKDEFEKEVPLILSGLKTQIQESNLNSRKKESYLEQLNGYDNMTTIYSKYSTFIILCQMIYDHIHKKIFLQ